MISAQVTIHTPHGLHLRPAGELAEEALKYRCRVSLAHGDKEISAKSLLGILSLCIRQDTEITVVCDGMDEQEDNDETGRTVTRLSFLCFIRKNL